VGEAERHGGRDPTAPTLLPGQRTPQSSLQGTTGGGPPTVQVASLSHVGQVRANNEDAWCEFTTGAGWRLLVVADGMGGHRGGEVASRIAVDTIGQVLGASHEEPEQSLRKAFLAANERIREVASREPRYAGMGTTAVALLLAAAGDAWVAHVGDSRAFVFRGGKLVPLTADHSYVAELQRQGLLSAAEAAVHPRRNEVLRSIGGEPDLEVEIRSVRALPGDSFLLCTDGLWGCVPEAELVGVLANAQPEEAVRLLVDLANQHGGPDNVTVQVAGIPEQADATAGTQWSRGLHCAAGGKALRRIRQLVITGALTAALIAALMWIFLHLGAKDSPSAPDATPPLVAPPGGIRP